MDEGERIALMESNLERQLSFVRAADTKVSIFLALATALLAAELKTAPERIMLDWRWPFWGFVVAIIVCGLSLAALVRTWFPSTSGGLYSALFFVGISDRKHSEYRTHVLEMSRHDYLDDLIQQTHRNAQIAKEKYKWLKFMVTARR